MSDKRKIRGRKAGKMDVKVKLPESSQYSTLTVEIRIDVERNDVLCVVDSREYSADTIDELKKVVAEAIAATQSVTWERYILIDYHASVKPTGGRSWRHNGLDVLGLGSEHQPEPGQEVHEISLTWREVYLSSVFTAAGSDRPERLEAWVNDDGTRGTARPDHRGAELPAGAVVWSPERVALLVETRRRLGMLDARLRELFTGAPGELGELGERLDEVRVARLLPEGKF